jgi:integrase
MAIYQRGKSKIWYIRFEVNGLEVHRSAKTKIKQEALELHDKLKSDAWKQVKLGEKPKFSWRDAVVRFMEESTRQHQDNDILALRWLDPYLSSMKLSDINRDTLQFLLKEKKKEGVMNATANRIVQFVRVILNKAHKEWSWIDSVPTVKLLEEPKRRIRFLTQEEATRLLNELPEHLNLMARFSLATGLRQSNVTGLEWSQVDLTRRKAWVHHDQAKAGKAIPVPLNNEAILVLRECQGKHDQYVFTYKQNPVKRTSCKAWWKALARAGIEDFRWHDLRHTWASWHVQNGTPLHILQELGGWSDVTMVQKYAHMGSDHLADYAGNVSKLSLVVTKTAQVANN